MDLAQTIRRRQRDLTRHVVAGITGTLPRYDDLPAEAVAADLTAATDRAIRTYLSVLADRRDPTDEELAAIADSAAERAEEGFTVDQVLGAYLLGVELVTERLADDIAGTDPAEVLHAVSRSMAFLRAVSGTILRQAGGDEQALLDLRLQTDHELLLALLAGTVDDALLERTGRHLPAAHVVVRFDVARHPDEDEPGVAGSIATRRKLRRLRDEVVARFGHDALTSVSATGGVVLVADDAARDDRWLREQLEDPVEQLGDRVGTPVHATAASAPATDTAPAGRLTAEVLDLVRRLGRPPGLHLLGDVAHEYQLTRPGPARRHLARVLEPVTAHPELVDTLRRYLATSGNRRRTALDLGVHPNTVDHRIRRIRDLLGAPVDVVQLSGCLLALDAERDDTEQGDEAGTGARTPADPEAG